MPTDDERDAAAAEGREGPSRDVVLTFAGVEPSGDSLFLTDPDGAAYVLPVTPPLRLAVRRANVAGGGPAPVLRRSEPPAPLASPREIQARVRAGESTEDIAAACGVPVAHVRKYEGPVIAEREFVAEQAQGARVGRSSDSPALGELVTDRLASRGADPGSLRWDASRPGSEGWVVTVTFTVGDRERAARWAFNPQARTLKALEDEARWLSETTISDEPIPRRHLAAVRESVFDVEAADLARPGFTRSVLDDVDGTATVDTTAELPGLRRTEDTAEEGPWGPRTDGSSAVADDATAALLDDLDARRGVRQRFEAVDAEDDGDGLDDGSWDGAAPVSGAHARDEQPATNARIYALPGNADLPAPDQRAEQDHETAQEQPARGAAPEHAPLPADAGPAETPAQEPAGAAARSDDGPAPAAGAASPAKTSKGSRKGRSKVPSWDEIVFGAKSD